MASSSTANQKSIGVVLFVVIIAGAAWGIYAWKFNATEDTAGNGDPILATAGSIDNGAESSDSPVNDRVESPDLGSAVRANTPSTVADSPTEIRVPDNASNSHGNGDQDNPEQYGATAAAALKNGRDALAGGQVIKARAALSRALALGIGPSDQEFVRRELTRLTEALLLGRAASPEDPLTGIHVVKGGESLFVIAAKYRISEELIMTLNQIKDRDTIYAGARLKIINGPFSAKILKSAHRMDIYLGDIYVRSFQVGLGTAGGTPTGEWTIKSKLQNPDWSDPATGAYYAANDPDNPIGERWISLECVSGECMGRIGFGIHGTIDPKSIGADMSMGCVRLSAEDVAATFDLLVQKYSSVSILP